MDVSNQLVSSTLYEMIYVKLNATYYCQYFKSLIDTFDNEYYIKSTIIVLSISVFQPCCYFFNEKKLTKI